MSELSSISEELGVYLCGLWGCMNLNDHEVIFCVEELNSSLHKESLFGCRRHLWPLYIHFNLGVSVSL